MKNIFLSLICFFLLSCKTNAHETEHNSVNEIISSDSTVLILQDSSSISKDGKLMLEATQTIPSNDEQVSILNINLLEKKGDSWDYIQNVKDTLSGISDPEIEIIDINNKGLIDINFKYHLAGRGYNEIRKHYIFDKDAKRLVAIKNSPHYSNITYNEELDCFESHAAFGGYATTFLILDGDSLRGFASIEMYDKQRMVSITNKYGGVIIDAIPYDLDDENADLTYGDYDYLFVEKI